MTEQDMFFLIGGVLFLVGLGGMVLDWILGPDKDLAAPWRPGDRPWWRP